jgi:hypothetical protein
VNDYAESDETIQFDSFNRPIEAMHVVDRKQEPRRRSGG